MRNCNWFTLHLLPPRHCASAVPRQTKLSFEWGMRKCLFDSLWKGSPGGGVLNRHRSSPSIPLLASEESSASGSLCCRTFSTPQKCAAFPWGYGYAASMRLVLDMTRGLICKYNWFSPPLNSASLRLCGSPTNGAYIRMYREAAIGNASRAAVGCEHHSFPRRHMKWPQLLTFNQFWSLITTSFRILGYNNWCIKN